MHIQRVVAGKALNGPLVRVIGTVDAVGHGTEHEVCDVNPFVLLDHVKAPFTQAGLPPFGMHPHHGLQVATLMWEGALSSQLGSSKQDDPPDTFRGAGMCPVAFAGRGLSHDEHTASDESTLMSQLIWLIPEAERSSPARMEIAEPAGFLPAGPGASVCVAVGEAFGRKSPVVTATPITMVFGNLDPDATIELPALGGGTFIFVADGALKAQETEIPTHNLAILEGGPGKVIARNIGKEAARFIYGSGERIDEPWVKLLTHNGFILCRDLEEARRQEEILKRVGLENYGQLN